MKQIITEELRYRQRAVEYALKHGNYAQAARRYRTSRQQISRWVKRYDGTIDSLRPLSRRPHKHPNAHREEEMTIIKHCYRYFATRGLAHVYRECQQRGYTRHFQSMLKMIKRHIQTKFKPVEKKRYSKSKWKPQNVTFPGEKVQIDIKYVPQSCIKWESNGVKYYQITAIDEYSRKRECAIVDEKCVTHTTALLTDIEEQFGFKIKPIQTDNGREFKNNADNTPLFALAKRES